MADNLKILKANLDQAIDPNAGIGEILAQDHNDVFTEFINKSGKYTGAPYLSIKEAKNGIVPTGVLVWNNNAMNETDEFVITVSKKTLDLNHINRLLDTLGETAIMHFKDFVGRSVHLLYVGHELDEDANGDDIYNIIVKGFSENTNYTYQADESELCVIEFYNVSKPANQTFLTNVQVKYFNLFDGPTWQESTIQQFTFSGTNQSFSLANNEIGLFYQKGQNNDADIYDYEEMYIFTKGGGTWGAAGTPVTEDDFVLIHKSQFATNLPLGVNNQDIPFDVLGANIPITKVSQTSEYLLAIHKNMARRLDLVQLLFSWSSRADDAAATPRSVYSKRIDGNYNLLSVTFQDFGIMKIQQDPTVKYTLLIDRYRPHEWKGDRPVHRKSKYRHEIIPAPDGQNTGRINEIPIDNSTMILDFKQDFYFRDYAGKIDQHTKFPLAMGMSPSRQNTNNIYLKFDGGNRSVNSRRGWVDLGFRIRMENQNGFKYETRYLGFIRMLGVSQPGLRYITYVTRQY